MDLVPSLIFPEGDWSAMNPMDLLGSTLLTMLGHCYRTISTWQCPVVDILGPISGQEYWSTEFLVTAAKSFNWSYKTYF